MFNSRMRKIPLLVIHKNAVSHNWSHRPNFGNSFWILHQQDILGATKYVGTCFEWTIDTKKKKKHLVDYKQDLFLDLPLTMVNF